MKCCTTTQSFIQQSFIWQTAVICCRVLSDAAQLLTYYHLNSIENEKACHKLLLCIQDASKAEYTEDVIDHGQIEQEVQCLSVGQHSCMQHRNP